MILKSFFIGFLGLVLLIPTLLIMNLVSERQVRQRAAVEEISSKWGGSQTVTGPLIGIPYRQTVTTDNKTHEEKKWAYFLPTKLDIQTRILPEIRYRGIFQSICYTTELQIKGSFDSLRVGDLLLSQDQLNWEDAAVFMDISDVKGLREDVTLNMAGADLTLTPSGVSTEQFESSLTASLPSAQLRGQGPMQFSATLQLKGSGYLRFVPVGRDTKVEASSTWAHPSFTGTYLPDVRTVQDSGFVAAWRVLYLNRNFPQQWKDNLYDLSKAAFGVDLIIPVDSYQQTIRSVKYAILIILLTFTAFFLIEWINGKRIHTVQYMLVGFALCLFYTLLLSFSEYIGFGKAYGIAAVATIGLIAWYVQSILRSGKMGLLVAALLAVQYTFVYTLIQLQDNALLMGSIGLFVTLGVVMYFSRKIKWEQN